MATITKVQAGYRATTGEEHYEGKRCGTCDMITSPTTCSLVEGRIDSANHICASWERTASAE